MEPKIAGDMYGRTHSDYYSQVQGQGYAYRTTALKLVYYYTRYNY